MKDTERRAFQLAELRVANTDGKRKIVGYAAVFNTLSLDLGGFVERIRPGAFSKTIKTADVRALWNHDPNYVLGRTKSGTLRLAEDDKGLRIEIDPPDTTWANDLITSIERGDVDQMSFGFRAIRDEWKKEGGQTVRELIEVELFDVSPVTFPAYEATQVSVRAALAARGIDFERLAGISTRAAGGSPLTEEDQAVISQAIASLQRLADSAGQVRGAEQQDGEGTQERAHVDVLMRRLALAECEI